MSPFIYTIRWKDNYSVHCTYPQLLLYALFSPVLAVFDKDDLLYYHAVQPLIGHKQNDTFSSRELNWKQKPPRTDTIFYF